MARTVSIARRKVARRMAASTTAFQQRGVLWAAKVGNHVYASVMKSYRARRQFNASALRNELAVIRPNLAQGMMTAWLQGFLDSREMLTLSLDLNKSSSIFDSAVRNLQNKADADPKALKELYDKFDTKAGAMLRTASEEVEKKLEKRMVEIISKNLPLRAGVKALSEEFDACGLTPGNSFQLEAIFRTQMSMAYGAGKQQAEQSDVISDLVWGYQYCTVGDDRVREAHAELDGVVLPASNSFWSKLYPPNGWCCRCQALPLLEPEDIVEPPTGYEADDGFDFAPVDLYNNIEELPKVEQDDLPDTDESEDVSPNVSKSDESQDVARDELSSEIDDEIQDAIDEAEAEVKSIEKKLKKKKGEEENEEDQTSSD